IDWPTVIVQHSGEHNVLAAYTIAGFVKPIDFQRPFGGQGERAAEQEIIAAFDSAIWMAFGLTIAVNSIVNNIIGNSTALNFEVGHFLICASDNVSALHRLLD